MINTNYKLEPGSVYDFAFSDPKSRALLEGVVSGRIPFPLFGKNVLCLCGTYGTGKTTLARLLPKLLEQCPSRVASSRPGALFEGEYYCDFTPCGSGANSVTMMQDLKKRVASDASYSGTGWHYEIFDEVDLLTAAAQASLKATITQASSTVFIFTTNHLNKLDRGLVDRAHLIEMNQPSPQEMVRVGRLLLSRLGLETSVDDETLAGLAEKSRGSMRDFGNAVAVSAFKCPTRQVCKLNVA
jgi:DNA polymerase III delta prime subunit